MIDVKSGETQAAHALSPDRDAHAGRGLLNLAPSGGGEAKRPWRDGKTWRRPATDGCVVSELASGSVSAVRPRMRTPSASEVAS
jgi:hypothetical protein